MLSIENVAYHVPTKKLDVVKERAYFNLSILQAKTFARVYGLQTIPTAHEMSMLEFIQSPVELVLKTLKPADVKVLIHAHTANIIVPFGRSIVRELQTRLNLVAAIAFGTTLNNCASTINAFEMAALLLREHGPEAKAIVVTGEKAFTPSVRVIPNSSITGDAAAAAVISNHTKKNRLLSVEIRVIGKYSKGIWMTPAESKDFEKNYIQLLAGIILAAIKKAKLALENIKIILPHNVNLISWFTLASFLRLPRDKIFLSNVKRYGHCFGSDILINYVDAVENNLILPGDYFLMVTVGLGATFAAAVFQH